jgi:hypothetical protein
VNGKIDSGAALICPSCVLRCNETRKKGDKTSDTDDCILLMILRTRCSAPLIRLLVWFPNKQEAELICMKRETKWLQNRYCVLDAPINLGETKRYNTFNTNRY